MARVQVDLAWQSARRPASKRWRSFRACPNEDRRNCPPQNLQIQPKRPIVDVFQVQPDPVSEILNVVAAADLPQASHAWLDTEPPAVRGVIEPLHLVHRQRAGANQAHL